MNAQTKLKTVENVLDDMDAATGPHVYRAIAEVQGELAKTGIAKNRKNQQGSGYMFRGIDDVYAALSPLLSAHKLVVVPRVLSREVIDRQSKNGGALFYVTVHAEFDFVSAIDGTRHTAATFGEAMDSGDKATNKAMSAAYKYAAFMTFAIPTEGDNDSENATYEVAARPTTGETPPAKRVELADPYTSKTALQAAAKQFVLTLERMGDLDDFVAWQQTPEVVEFCVQLERDMPSWWAGGPDVPAEFVPLEIRIAQKKLDLEQIASLKEPV